MSHDIVRLGEIEQARVHIAPHVRRTPLVAVAPARTPLCPTARAYLKLESLQITGSFKARGAMNKLASLPPDEVARGLVTASGGNHGAGVAYAAWLAKTRATIFVPKSTPEVKIAKLEAWDAAVIVEGEAWDDANRAAIDHARRTRSAYVHPFCDPAVIAGQGTIALEILEAKPEMDLIVVPIGGGGLASGVAVAAKALRPSIRIVGVEPIGAPTLAESLRAGAIVELPRVDTKANTLAARRTEPLNFELIRAHFEGIVLVSDEEMKQAAEWLWFEMGVAAELSGAAATAALRTGKARVVEGSTVCAIVSGAGKP